MVDYFVEPYINEESRSFSTKKAPNPKLQTPEKLQTPNLKLFLFSDVGRAFRTLAESIWGLVLGAYLVFGVWSLGFLPPRLTKLQRGLHLDP
jgi:hypothetical protein